MAQRLGDIPSTPRACDALTTALPAAAAPGPRDGSSDTARRFKKQIFLSIDVAPSLGSMGQEGKLLLAIERAVVDVLRADEGLAAALGGSEAAGGS